MAEELPPEDATDSLFDNAIDTLERLLGIDPPTEPYFERIGIERPKGKVVALDAAIMAAHLFAAKVSFRSFPATIKARIFAMEKKAAEIVAQKTVQWAFARVIGYLLTFVRIMADTWSQNKAARELEGRIRRAAHQLRQELIGEAMIQRPTGVRKTELVSTRHKGKK